MEFELNGRRVVILVEYKGEFVSPAKIWLDADGTISEADVWVERKSGYIEEVNIENPKIKVIILEDEKELDKEK